MTTPPDATARVFDPTKPFRCRNGQTVTKFKTASENPHRLWRGEVAGVYSIWCRPNGNYRFDRKPHPLDLVNVDPAPDAGEFDLDELLRLAEVTHKTLGDVLRDETGMSEAFAFYAVARNAIPHLPAYIARQRAEARRKALEEAAGVAGRFLQHARFRRDNAMVPPAEWVNKTEALDEVLADIAALIDKEPTP